MINKILTTKTKSNNSAIFFDLDSTLYDVSPRSKKILLEISQDPIFKNKFPEQCNKLERAEVHATDWGIEEALSRLEITGTVDFFKSITLLWRQKFFSNEYLKHDVPYEGAVDFVKELDDSGFSIYYLTGRDTERMLLGSQESLIEYCFPLAEKERLIMKPKKGESDSRFKLEVLKENSKKYDNIWFVENEPVNINLVLAELPHVNIMYFDSVHSGREEISSQLPTLKMRF